MSRIGEALEARWFVEGSAMRLAVLRIVVALAALWYLGPRLTYFSTIAASSPSLFEPVGVIRVLHAPVPVGLFQAIMASMLVLNVAFIVGWRFSVTGPIFAALLVWVLCYRNSWSMIYHNDNLLVIQAVILGLTRSADALSLDALRWRHRVTSPEAPQPTELHWEYGYPIMLLCAATAVTYVLSGVAKIASPAGLSWGLGDTLRSQVAFDGLRKDLIAKGAEPMAFILYENVGLATILGVGTLVLELGAPLALLNRRLGQLWAFGTFLMHWGIWAIMGITFWYHLSGLSFLPFLLEEWHVTRGREMGARGLRTFREWQAGRNRAGPVASEATGALRSTGAVD